MLNPFPIQFLALLAFFILRVIVGFAFIHLAQRHFKHRQALHPTLVLPFFPFGKIHTFVLIITELVIGVMFLVGFYTQIAALLTILMSLKMLVLRNKFVTPHLPNRLTYLLLFGIGCSLFITGAGIFAFDLPI
ncbi:MAG TPA: hypothetical protein PKA42_00340 [Candidatus Paceibacterota bacterium]|nr:hypothetical protein [Candidatus Paceibacterota bacterium]HMO82594.1 hypothetical protein [Candidatus Paceibacterota bacterium]